MHRTANQFIQQQKMLGLAVMGTWDYLDPGRPEELSRSQEARVEFGLLLDLTVKEQRKGNSTVFCPKEPFFFFVWTKGRLPQKKGELA